MDKLLGKLAEEGVGCYIGNIFVGALAYADDIVLLAPTARAMRLMLCICDHYALEYSNLFNAKKSKCISFGPCFGYSSPKKNLPAFFIRGSVVDYVHSWPRLGHIIVIPATIDFPFLRKLKTLYVILRVRVLSLN